MQEQKCEYKRFSDLCIFFNGIIQKNTEVYSENASFSIFLIYIFFKIYYNWHN